MLLFAVEQECGRAARGAGDWELSTSEVPKRLLSDTTMTLKDSGLSVNTLLHLESCQ